ncbi:hypothetical protein ACFYOF_16690 [Streptomyces sp. NPDC007148]|uniref:hypothetical protein n=1 Tax=Streptomyces sp. NPDC007148 TaxID=3364775 RepID=UPI00368492B1
MTLTDAELDQLIKNIGLKRPRGGSRHKPIAHGEYKGARQHRYRNEPLCEPCRVAENAYQNERNAQGLRKKAGPKPKQYLTEEEGQRRRAGGAE